MVERLHDYELGGTKAGRVETIITIVGFYSHGADGST
jgi:hypothetical protein